MCPAPDPPDPPDPTDASRSPDPTDASRSPDFPDPSDPSRSPDSPGSPDGPRPASSTTSLDELAGTGRSVDERFARRLEINVPTTTGARLAGLIERVNEDDEVYAQWIASNVNAMERLGMTDHGPVHVKIVMNIALKILRLLVDRDVKPSVVRNYGMQVEDAEVVVGLAALFHDLGMSIHRPDHETFSLFLADRKLRELLPSQYDGPAASVIRSEILHAIISHRSGGNPLTVEGGIVRIADSLDMAKGRSRIPFEAGSQSIHSISAAAIEAVSIEAGDDKPVRVAVTMSNSAGVFQIDRLFREKLRGSGLEAWVELEARVEGETEKRLVQTFKV